MKYKFQRLLKTVLGNSWINFFIEIFKTSKMHSKHKIQW